MNLLQLQEPVSGKQAALAVNYLRLVLQTLHEQGVETQGWLESAGITQERLNDPTGFVSFSEVNQLLENQEIVASFDYLGLLLGRKLPVSAHGVIGHLMMAGKTYLEGIELVMRFLKIRTQLITLDMRFEGQHVVVAFTPLVGHPQLRRLILDSALSGAYHLCQQFYLHRQPIVGLNFDCSENRFNHTFSETVNCACQFDQAGAEILIDMEAVLQSTGTENPLLLKIAQQQCEALLEELGANENFHQRVSALLMSTPEYCFNQQKLAECLNMSSRTLRRKLEQEGFQYQQLVDDAMQRQAKTFLAQPQWSVAEIADLLGYSDVNCFNKAFQRWFNTTASAYRKQLEETTV